MHALCRLKPSDDPWKKLTLLTLQQLAEDMRVNEKRVCALEKSIAALEDVLAGAGTVGAQNLTKVTAALHDVHEEISTWSTQSLDRAEELAVVVRQLASEQDAEPDLFRSCETKRLAG